MEVTPTTTPATTTDQGNAARSLGGLATNFDNFLTILTTQLKNQDPLSPLDSNEFTSQLVQFTSVEQQVLQNKNLETMIALQKQSQTVGAVSYIGKLVEATGSANMLSNGQATFTYILPQTATAAAIQIFDASGDLVFQQPVETSAGLHDFVWDGSTAQGGTAPDGVYTFAVGALDKDKEAIEVEKRVLGLVTGVSFQDGKTTLGIGEIGVPLETVTGIQEPPDTTG